VPEKNNFEIDIAGTAIAATGRSECRSRAALLVQD